MFSGSVYKNNRDCPFFLDSPFFDLRKNALEETVWVQKEKIFYQNITDERHGFFATDYFLRYYHLYINLPFTAACFPETL